MLQVQYCSVIPPSWQMNTTHAVRVNGQDCSSTTVPVNEYSLVDPYSVAEYVRHITVA